MLRESPMITKDKIPFKAGFHWRRSRSRKRSRERSHNRDGIGVKKIRAFPFLPTPLTTPSLTVRL